jgi:hypothetical protein
MHGLVPADASALQTKRYVHQIVPAVYRIPGLGGRDDQGRSVGSVSKLEGCQSKSVPGMCEAWRSVNYDGITPDLAHGPHEERMVAHQSTASHSLSPTEQRRAREQMYEGIDQWIDHGPVAFCQPRCPPALIRWPPDANMAVGVRLSGNTPLRQVILRCSAPFRLVVSRCPRASLPSR